MALIRGTLYGLVLVGLACGTAVAQPKPKPPPGAKPGPAPKITPKGPPAPRLSKEGIDFFEKKIRPVLIHNCYKCHAGDPQKAKGHFVLDTRDGLLKGGESGEVIEPRHPEKSLLVEAIKYEGLEMPPEGQLPDDVIEDFEKWIEMGAPDPRMGKAANPQNKVDLAEAKRYWAFQPPKATAPPSVHEKTWPRTDIDRFVLARMEQEQLRPVADADRTTLIRRLSFDLVGLPPTPEEIDAFVNDKSPGAVPALVDRLLASPQFGERWGRHWLDVVRYGESTGKERNVPYRYAWRYRDYVIDSFNADKPYDRFIVEQLAGDLLPAKSVEQQNQLAVATGFLAIGPKSVNTKNAEQFKVDVIDDQIDATGRAFLGMTIACARCHDHKFDPIPQTDYYAIAGIFHSTRTFAGVAPGKRSAAEQNLLALRGEDRALTAARPATSEQLELQHEIASVEKRLDDLKRMQKQATKQAPKGKLGKRPKRVQMASSKGPKVDRKQVRDDIKKLEDRLDELEKNPTPLGNYAIGVRDAAEPGNTHLLERGELKDKGPEVPRGVLTVLRTAQSNGIAKTRHSGRMELANWVADRHNPLTARVMVNRVWEHLFGQGLVDTVDNFGALGNEPSHPELLDNLAVQFIDVDKWSVKKLIRSIVLSRTYQLSSVHDSGNFEHDPSDRYLWRMPRRRLDAEAIRDAMLVASGRIELQRPVGSPVMDLGNRQLGGGGKGMQEVRRASNVRSAYLPILRGQVPEVLGVFDMADPNLIVGKRDVTTVPTQALFLMNNPFVLAQSEAMAKRVLSQPSLDQKARITLAYQLALGRAPTQQERTTLARFIDSYRKSVAADNPNGNAQLAAWTSLCQLLFQSGEFRYVY
jgi:hypothetical protein